MRFAYVTPKKIGVYIQEDWEKRLDEVRNIAQTMERFLSMSDDAEELAGIVCPDYDSFYWNTQEARATGYEVFGF